MPVKLGKKHMYLGMDTELTERGTVKVSMTGYIEDFVDDFLEEFTTPVVNPAAEHLFKINTSGKALREEQAILLHRLIENLIFVSKRDRPDIRPTIEFLTTRVQDPDEYDWKNLRRLLQ